MAFRYCLAARIETHRLLHLGQSGLPLVSALLQAMISTFDMVES